MGGTTDIFLFKFSIVVFLRDLNVIIQRVIFSPVCTLVDLFLEFWRSCNFVIFTFLWLNVTVALRFAINSRLHRKKTVTLPQKTQALEMRSTMLRLAESVSKTPLNLQEASAALYPPIPYALLLIILGFVWYTAAVVFFDAYSLYRRLLRAHRNLSPDMRPLGDKYVKSGNV